jgi:hypothetical protein
VLPVLQGGNHGFLHDVFGDLHVLKTEVFGECSGHFSCFVAEEVCGEVGGRGMVICLGRKVDIAEKICCFYSPKFTQNSAEYALAVRYISYTIEDFIFTAYGIEPVFIE